MVPATKKPPLKGNAAVKVPNGLNGPQPDYPAPKPVNPRQPQQGNVGSCSSRTRAPLQGGASTNLPWLVTGPVTDPVYGYFNIYTLNLGDDEFEFSGPSSKPTDPKILKKFPFSNKSLGGVVAAATPGTARTLTVTTLVRANGQRVSVNISMPVFPSATKCNF